MCICKHNSEYSEIIIIIIIISLFLFYVKIHLFKLVLINTSILYYTYYLCIIILYLIINCVYADAVSHLYVLNYVL